MDEIKKQSLELHEKLKGKLEVVAKGEVSSMKDLALLYSPGVGAVSSYVAEHPDEMRIYTGTNNSVAVISDGSAVLGLGDIGPKGAMPVMEGKAVLFKTFAGIDGYPVVLDVHEADEIINVAKAIAPSYGAINLEDIAAPKCFEVEERLKAELDIPVFHDDQHGTAIVTLAGLINALKVAGKDFKNLRVTIVGAGAAGTAIAKLLAKYEESAQIMMVDSKGIISSDRDDLNDFKKALLGFTNRESVSGDLNDAIKGSDVFIGVSKAGLVTKEMVKSMSDKPIIFAMANPVPEIMPDEAKEAGAVVIGTGRSDFPNQVNNAVAFPGVFRGALDNQVKNITDDHKIAAAEAIAQLIENPTADEVIPNVFDDRLVPAIAAVIK